MRTIGNVIHVKKMVNYALEMDYNWQKYRYSQMRPIGKVIHV